MHTIWGRVMQSRINYSEFLINDGSTLKLDSASIELIEADMPQLVAFISRNPGVTGLDLSGQPLSPVSCAALAVMLRGNRTLKSLSLKQTGIDCNGVTVLAEALVENSGLRTLNLSGNQIKDNGARALTDVVHIFRNLSIVVLSHNFLSDHAVLGLTHAFYQNEYIRRIDLSHQSGKDNEAVLDRPQAKTNKLYEALPEQSDELIRHDSSAPYVEIVQSYYYSLDVENYYGHHAILWSDNASPSAPEAREEQDAANNNVKRSNS